MTTRRTGRVVFFAALLLFTRALLRADVYVANLGFSGTPSVTVYAPTAIGNAAPIRTIAGANTQFNSPEGVFADLVNNELYVADFFGQAVRVFPLNSNGNVAPIRQLVAGPNSGLDQVRAVVIDTTNNEMIVCSLSASGTDSIRVYPRTANGDVAPTRVIGGTTTLINNPISVAFDPVNDELFVDSYNVGGPSVAGILVFNRTDSGNVAPKRSISGSNTQIGTFTNFVALDLVNSEIFAQGDSGDGIVVFNRTDNGNVAPLRNLTGPNTGLSAGSPGGILIDNANNRITTCRQQGSSHPNDLLVFSRTASGDTKPLMSVFGPATGLADPFGLAMDGAGGFTGTDADTTIPTVSPFALTTPMNTPVGFTLTATDPDDTVFVFDVPTPPVNGSVTLNASTGAGTYTPNNTYSGPDSFAYTAFDGTNTSAPATVSITVSGAPAPTATVPALGPIATAVFGLLLALVGLLVMRKMSS